MTQQAKDKVSIRLMSGGHSFSGSEGERQFAGASVVEVTLVTHKSVLVPMEGLVPEDAEYHLAAVGLMPTLEERVVCSAPHNGIVAVMAVAKSCYDYLAGLSAQVVYLSPLLVEDAPEEGSVLTLYGDTLYVCVYRAGLRFAEAIAVHSDADLLYYVESIHRVYGIYNMYARAKGDVERLRGACKHLFKSLVCE